MIEGKLEIAKNVARLVGRLGKARLCMVKDKLAAAMKAMVPKRLSEKTINEVLAFREWAPGLKKLELHFGEGRVEFAVEAEQMGIKVKAAGSVEVKAVKITAHEQMVRVMPLGPFRIATENQEIVADFKPGPALLKEWAVLLAFLPPELKSAVAIDDSAVTILAHKLPHLTEELRRRTTKQVLGKTFSLLDFVEIENVILEPGAVRIVMK